MEIAWLAAFCLLSTAGLPVTGASKDSHKLSKPELLPGHPDITMGRPVTISCLFRNASFPVTFMLFLNTSFKGKMMLSEEEEAKFNITICNVTELGPYKCKVNNSQTTGKYSDDFTFALQEPTTHGSELTGQ
ncbi:allergin-1-like [Mantella aurantiaca]